MTVIGGYVVWTLLITKSGYNEAGGFAVMSRWIFNSFCGLRVKRQVCDSKNCGCNDRILGEVMINA